MSRGAKNRVNRGALYALVCIGPTTTRSITMSMRVGQMCLTRKFGSAENSFQRFKRPPLHDADTPYGAQLRR